MLATLSPPPSPCAVTPRLPRADHDIASTHLSAQTPISTAATMVQPASNGAAQDLRNTKPSPERIWSIKDPPFEGIREVDTEGYRRSDSNTAIVIDNGTLSSYLALDLPTTDAAVMQARPPYAPAGTLMRTHASPSRP